MVHSLLYDYINWEEIVMKRITKVTAMALTFAMGLSLMPAGSADAAKVKVTKVAVTDSITNNSKTVVVAKGKTVKLNVAVTVKPDKKANKKVTFASKNKKIATVSKKGVVKGIKAGKTKVVVTSAKNKKKKATINVKVVAGAVSKVTLNKTSGTLNVGETAALKATVKAGKGAVKTVAWSSSKEAVATVSNKGVVTAVAAGTATITAAATDGSGKKATYKVTVSNPVNITGIQVLNAQSVTFSLNQPYALAPGSVSVMKKVYQDGVYRNQLVIENMSTADNVNYTIVLDNDSRIYENNYVQVSIPTLPGTVNTMEMLYREPVVAFTQEEISRWRVNEFGSDSFGFNNDMGYSALSIANLPAGLVAENKNGYLTVKGVPTTPGVTDATITGVDEIGNTVTEVVHFIVGSDTVLAGAATAIYNVNSGTETKISKRISVIGGSGSYKLAVAPNGDPSGLVTNKDAQGVIDATFSDDYYEENTNSGIINISVKLPGTYSITLTATDVKDPAKVCNVVIPLNIVQGISVGGGVLDASGNKISGARIEFTNKNKADLYSRYESAYTDENGVYSATLVAGNYDIEVTYGSSNNSTNAKATKYLYNQPLMASATGYDLQLPLYKVVIGELTDPATGEKHDAKYLTWKSNYETVGQGDVLYLKPGTYVLEAEETVHTTNAENVHVIQKYKYTSTVTVVNAPVLATMTRTLVSEVKDENDYYFDAD
jgi:uncharacterized protein YjdB